jgi:ABC-type nitrate/sulfonate/bicarbonate transport system substrate-binding protein
MTREKVTNRRAYLSALAVGTATLAGCTADSSNSSSGSDSTNKSSGSNSTNKQDLREITFATTKTGSVGVLTNIIKEEGFDKQHGIKIKEQATSPSKAAQLLVNNAVEAGLMSPQGAAVANTKGSNIRLFGPILSNHNSLMTTPENTDIQSWKDLKGKRVGILSPPSGIWNHTHLLLNEIGISPDNFDFRKGSPGAIHAFNERGDVAAHIHFIPVSVKAIAGGEMREVLFYPNKFKDLFGNNLQFVPLAAHQSWLEKNPDAARSLRAALIKAQKLILDNPKDTITKYMEVIGLENQDQVNLAVKRMPATYPAAWGRPQKKNIKTQLKLSKKYGIIPDNAPINIAVVNL